MGDALTRALAGVLVTVLAVLVLFNAALTAILGGGGGTWACHTNDATTATDLPLDAEQTDIAATILAVARDLDLPERAAIIALAAALQESGLRNLHHGDRDSLGVFQQRPSQGWGTTPAGPTDHRTPTHRILDPTHAATEFYRALLAVPGWADLAVTDAAQRVQRSAFPGAYAKWEALATTITHTLAGQRCTGSPGHRLPRRPRPPWPTPAPNSACPTNGAVTGRPPETLASIARASPAPPTPPPASPCRVPPRPSTTPDHGYPLAPHPNPGTSSSTAPAPPTSLTSASSPPPQP